MCKIKFQGGSLKTFFIYEVVQDPENDDLGVVGPPGPARSVTVKKVDMFFQNIRLSKRVNEASV